MNIRNILVLLLGIGLLACSRRNEFRQGLAQAEALMVEHPDSAYGMLCDMEGQAEEMPKALRMRYWLLRCNAQNKADVPFASDSIGTLLAEYYDRHGSPNERMLAHYMQGCAYRDRGDWPSAVRCFNRATAAADTAAVDCDFRQLSIIYGQLAYIYDNQYLMDEALQAYEQAERYAQDTLTLLNFKGHKANVLIDKGEINKGLMLKEAVIDAYHALGAFRSAARSKGMCIKWYAQQGNFTQAKAAMDEYEILSGFFLPNGNIEPGREDYYFIKGSYYEEKGDLDSAEFYFRKLQQLGKNLNDHHLSVWGLTRIYYTKGLQDSVAKYAVQTVYASDSLYDENVAQNLQQAQAMYNYNRHQETAHRKGMEAKEAQIRLRNFIIAGTALFFTAILLALQYRRKLRLKMARLKRKMRSRLAENSAVVYLLNKDIAEKMQLIESLNKQLNENAANLQESEQMRQTIHILEQKIHEHRQEIAAFTQSQHTSQLHEEPAVIQFIQKVKRGKERPNKEEWQRVCMLVEVHYPRMQEIKNLKDVSSKEYRICVLLKLGLDLQSIVLLEDSSNANLTNIRRRLLKKLFDTEGGAKDFDRMLAEI